MQLLPTSILSHLLTSYRGWTFQRDMMITFTKYVVSTYCSNGSLSFLLLNFLKMFLILTVCAQACVYNYTHVCACHLDAGIHRSPKWATDPLELELWAIISCQIWVPRTKLVLLWEHKASLTVKSPLQPSLNYFYSLIILFFYTCLTE